MKCNASTNSIHIDIKAFCKGRIKEAFGQGLVARGQHIILSDDISSARTYQQAAVLSPQLSFMATSMSLDQWIQSGFQPYSAISQQLPFGIQVLTLSKWKSENQILLRLQHIYSKERFFFSEDDFMFHVEFILLILILLG